MQIDIHHFCCIFGFLKLFHLAQHVELILFCPKIAFSITNPKILWVFILGPFKLFILIKLLEGGLCLWRLFLDTSIEGTGFFRGGSDRTGGPCGLVVTDETVELLFSEFVHRLDLWHVGGFNSMT